MIHSYNIMIIIMILSGLLSSMWVWSDKISDIRITLNDLFMIGLMTAWMISFMSVINSDKKIAAISLLFVSIFYFLIRFQYRVGLKQFYQGMIPHHSMAILMGKNVLKKSGLNQQDRQFIENIITTQEGEIQWMKNRLKTI